MVDISFWFVLMMLYIWRKYTYYKGKRRRFGSG